ncbi:phosphoglycerate kinase-like [Lepeophtheirus salmonis]|uniref:phosphoglycerate kinase-like n=1 Tax=Lepeophtheirus salmonis TaxID=72036 RepID=UPI001AE14A4B|nr:phosphoglycerate kinase-like [Lepeophtheirus salmonis]
MLENMRFYDLDAKFFEDRFDVIVFDAFGVSHRNCKELDAKMPIYTGPLVYKELKIINKLKKTDLAIIGGCKTDKLKLARSLNCKTIILGKLIDTVIENKEDDKYIMPVDIKCIDMRGNINILDIGPKTIGMITSYLDESSNVFLNGTPGIYEKLESRSGGDTNTALDMLNIRLEERSTGGGVLLQYLVKGELEGIRQIEENKKKELHKLTEAGFEPTTFRTGI